MIVNSRFVLQTFPSYPINRWNISLAAEQTRKETAQDDPMYVLGFQGVVPEEEYQKLLKLKWLGRKVPIDFHGYNNYPDYWPFWCSEPYTYVTTMLALAKFSNTVEN